MDHCLQVQMDFFNLEFGLFKVLKAFPLHCREFWPELIFSTKYKSTRIGSDIHFFPPLPDVGFSWAFVIMVPTNNWMLYATKQFKMNEKNK